MPRIPLWDAEKKRNRTRRRIPCWNFSMRAKPQSFSAGCSLRMLIWTPRRKRLRRLRDDNFEDIGQDVYDSIQVLGYDELNGRAGRQEWGYVEPGEAAAEILSETVGHLLDDLKRRVDLVM